MHAYVHAARPTYIFFYHIQIYIYIYIYGTRQPPDPAACASMLQSPSGRAATMDFIPILMTAAGIMILELAVALL